MTSLRIVLLSAVAAIGLAFSPTHTTPLSAFRHPSSSHPSTALKMANDEVKVGDKIPSVVLKEGQADYGKPADVNISELIAGKKVAIFAVPGAFTPGCSKTHLPSFITAKEELKAKGVELIICIATNDAYVMEVSVSFYMFICLSDLLFSCYNMFFCQPYYLPFFLL